MIRVAFIAALLVVVACDKPATPLPTPTPPTHEEHDHGTPTQPPPKAAAGKALAVIDVPSDVVVKVDGRMLVPCQDEYQAPAACSPNPRPGWARRYVVEVKRGAVWHVEAQRGAQLTASHDVAVKADGPAPHLRIDDENFAFRELGGIIDRSGELLIVDRAGNVVGPVGHSEPD